MSTQLLTIDNSHDSTHCTHIVWYSLYKGMSERLDVLTVQIGGGFIQGQDATVKTEGFCQSQPDDEWSQDLGVYAFVFMFLCICMSYVFIRHMFMYLYKSEFMSDVMIQTAQSTDTKLCIDESQWFFDKG